MANYTQITDFSEKDSLPTGNPNKIIKGADVDGELTAIAVAIATKGDAPAGAVVGTTDEQTLTNKTLESVILNSGYTEEVFTITDGASVNLDPANGTIQLWTLGANRTPTATGFDSGQSMLLMVDDGASRDIIWSSVAVTWKTDGGSAPELNLTGFTPILLWKVDSTIFGARVGDA